MWALGISMIIRIVVWLHNKMSWKLYIWFDLNDLIVIVEVKQQQCYKKYIWLEKKESL